MVVSELKSIAGIVRPSFQKLPLLMGISGLVFLAS